MNIKEFIKSTYGIIAVSVIAILLVTIIIFAFSGSHRFHKEVYHKYTTYEIYNETNMLIYDSIKLSLLHEVDNYIAKTSANASALSGLVIIDNCLEYDIDICFVMAQAEQESHFGSAGLARKTNSVFNVFAFDGHNYNMINANGKYAHPNDCVEPYIRLLKRDYLVNGKTEYDMLNEYVNKNGKRYASAETYEHSLVEKITKIKSNTNIDKIYQDLKKQKLIIGI